MQPHHTVDAFNLSDGSDVQDPALNHSLSWLHQVRRLMPLETLQEADPSTFLMSPC